ncbi:hypothetical protein [Burkholderia cepacia]|uniref:hypothetical protein n=1 Tax=Burkholderia cepacia TaxID=292 RepID=UPI000ADEE492|nr:hypothetical protein [Burkholderia cepacia]
MIDGEVSPELEGKALMQQAGDSAHARSTVPYGWSDNGSKEAALTRVSAPRLFKSKECRTGRDAWYLSACNFEDDEMIDLNMPIWRI